MKNFLAEGETMAYSNTSGTAIKSGDVVPMVSMCGIAMMDIAATTGSGTVKLRGVFLLAKATGETWTVGTKLYYNTTNLNCTTTVGSNIPIGTVQTAAASGDTTGEVRIA